MYTHPIFADLPQDTAENRLTKTHFLLEATHFETHMLWEMYCKESKYHRNHVFDKWEQLNGWLVNVGYLSKNLPVNISMHWMSMDGFIVCQWEPVSMLYDMEMAHDWLDKHYTRKTNDGRSAYTNTDNFHFLIQEYQTWKKTRDTTGDCVPFRNAPTDFENPQWDKPCRVHDWKNYISTRVMELWDTFSIEQKAAIASQADDQADKEQWD